MEPSRCGTTDCHSGRTRPRAQGETPASWKGAVLAHRLARSLAAGRTNLSSRSGARRATLRAAAFHVYRRLRPCAAYAREGRAPSISSENQRAIAFARPGGTAARLTANRASRLRVDTLGPQSLLVVLRPVEDGRFALDLVFAGLLGMGVCRERATEIRVSQVRVIEDRSPNIATNPCP